MDDVAYEVIPDASSGSRPRDGVAGADCWWCEGTGWADPWDLGTGSPELTWCPDCLGAGLDDCTVCDGQGTVAEPVACPCQERTAARAVEITAGRPAQAA